MKLKLVALAILCCLPSGCTVVTANNVFPRLQWYWSPEAQEQRRYNKEEKQRHEKQ